MVEVARSNLEEVVLLRVKYLMWFQKQSNYWRFKVQGVSVGEGEGRRTLGISRLKIQGHEVGQILHANTESTGKFKGFVMRKKTQTRCYTLSE